MAKFFTCSVVVSINLFLSTAPFAEAFEDTPPPLRLTIVGDSTVSAYPAGSPVHGWGEFIQERMRRRVRVCNVAVPGASSSSFLSEGRWDAALNERPGVVLIQFGHNDSFQAISPRQYQANLQRMVESARQHGAVPILVTPMQLRAFRKEQFVPSMALYAEAGRQLAAQAGIVVIDLNDLSGQLFARLGPARVDQLGSPGNDKTHFNRLGAQAMAEIVLHALSQTRTPLTREILTPMPQASAASTPKPQKAPARKGKGKR